MIKPLMILAGTASLLLDLTGIFIPGLPTTPFILLTAAFYVRSSPALYSKVVNHRLTGRYLVAKSGGIYTGARNLAILIMWVMIVITSISLIKKPIIIILLIIAGIAGTFYKLRFFRKHNNGNSLSNNY